MPFVLTNAHTPQCLHGGTVTKTPAPKLMIEGNPALTSVGPVTTCSWSPPPATNVKCTTVSITAGQATKLKVGGSPVLLSSLVATATSPPANPGGPISFVPPATPTKVNAV